MRSRWRGKRRRNPRRTRRGTKRGREKSLFPLRSLRSLRLCVEFPLFRLRDVPAAPGYALTMPAPPLLVEGLRLGIGEPEEKLRATAARRLNIDPSEIVELTITRRAIDARRKKDIHRLYHVEISLGDAALGDRILEEGLARVPRTRVKDPLDLEILDGVPHGADTLGSRPVVIGSGPGGLFAAWLLAREGYRPVVIERGPEVAPRVRTVRAFERGGPHDPENNILFGEGGAGTFSDGKLTTRGRTPLNRMLHQLLVDAGAPEDILIDSKPHIGTDRLRAVLVKLRRQLTAMGVTFRFQTRMVGIDRESSGCVRAILLEGGQRITTSAALLAIGHSARDTYEMLWSGGVGLEFKPFQLGLRIEHPQALIDRAQFGDFASRLPAAEYILSDASHGVFSFCMCPGGTIVASVSEAGHLCTNGMSRRRRDSGWANSGLVFTIGRDLVPGGGEHPLAGIELQRQIERRAFEIGGTTYALPAQRAGAFVKGRLSGENMDSSYALGLVRADLREVLPAPTAHAIRCALETFDRKIPGYLGEGLLVGPEARGSSPVRILRDPTTRQSPTTPGLFPVGEGAGYAGGIMSAAIDGLRSAAALIRGHGPCS